jgi:hypothetical protein
MKWDVLYDISVDSIASAVHDDPTENQTKIELDSALFSNDELIGHLLYCPVPGDLNDTLRIGRISDNDTDTIWVVDTGAYTIASAVFNGLSPLRGFLIMDAQTGSASVHSGSWDADPFYLSLGDKTRFTALAHGFSNVIGYWLRPDDTVDTWFEIVDYDTDAFYVEGDQSASASNADDFTIAQYPFLSSPAPQHSSGQWTAAASFSLPRQRSRTPTRTSKPSDVRSRSHVVSCVVTTTELRTRKEL